MIPSIQYDFNFDIVLGMIFISYLVYGYLSGGHKQIRLSINLILPFMVIYYLGSYITTLMYVPLKSTFFFEVIDTYLPAFKNTIEMVFAYIFTYIMLFLGVFLLSIYARRYVLNENMRAKLGKKNNYLGALFAFINGYVLVYFIILPVFSLNIVGGEAGLTNFVLEHPPPFSRIARTAEKAVPIKGLADKAEDFQQLMSVDGIEGYYNDAIYDYQQLYIGSDSYETSFMIDVYPEFSSSSKQLLDDEYFDYFGENLSASNYLGVSLILVTETSTSDHLYLDLLVLENDFKSELIAMEELVSEYEALLVAYDKDVIDYEYSLLYQAYLDDLDDYMDAAFTYVDNKVDTVTSGGTFTDTFILNRPTFSVVTPSGYVHEGALTEPSVITESTEVTEAIADLALYVNKIDISNNLSSYGVNFKNHRGLLTWYIEELDGIMASEGSGSDISEVIVSFKNNYDLIVADINDEELESKLYLAQMSIVSYDVFTSWLTCTMDNIDTVPLDEIELATNRCTNINTDLVTDYDFTSDALNIVTTLFEGDSVSWIILQYKYDYEAGGFVDEFEDYQEVLDILVSTKELVDEYDLYYKDIANSLEGNLSMVFKIGISVMKYHLDIYDTLSNTPILSAVFNDAARFCMGENNSNLNLDVYICPETDEDGGFLQEIFNMRFLATDILFKAYLMVDDENEAIIYDSVKMREFLEKANQSVEDNVITQEVISMFADQFAFNVIDEATNYTLLEQMYDDGQISIEAMRILADDEYELFSMEFRQRVRSLIR
ncbi:MAG: Colicin V production protein [Candidatus Izimaplasma bacterium HR2]|nr:MAG: Colicin V production protein [Candidatus Izimaplasma bacterium HR2]